MDRISNNFSGIETKNSTAILAVEFRYTQEAEDELKAILSERSQLPH